LIIWAVISIVIRESLVESGSQSLGTIIWVSEWCWSLVLWNSLDHHANGDVVVIRWVLLLISILLQDRVEGIVTNNLSETLKSNRFDTVVLVGWGNLKSDSLDLIDWDVDWHRVSFEVILSLGLDKAAGSWSVGMSSSGVVLSLNEASSMWLVVVVVVLLSLFVMLSVLVTSCFLLGFSLLLNESLDLRLDHVLDLTIGESLRAGLRKSLLHGASHSLNLRVHSSLRLGGESR